MVGCMAKTLTQKNLVTKRIKHLQVMAKLKENQIVVLRNGIIGVVTGFNGKPAQVVFPSFTKPARQYDEKTFVVAGTNRNYDIVEVYDGSSVETYKEIFSKKFKTEGLKRIWRAKE